MRVTRLSLQRPVTVAMVFLAVALLGLVSLKKTSVDLLPDVRYPKLSVFTRYSGAAPEELESRVAIPLETAASKIPGLKRLESLSSAGLVKMALEFDWGENMDFAMLHTREKMDSARLPDRASKPVIISYDPQSKPVVVLSLGGDVPLFELRQFASDLLKPRLEQIKGIGSAEITGGREWEVCIELDPSHLALYGLTIEGIASCLGSYGFDILGGTVKRGHYSYAAKVTRRFDRREGIADTILMKTENQGLVRLRDVAVVKYDMKRQEGLTKHNGRECIGVLVRKESGANTIGLTRKIKDVLDGAKAENPDVEWQIVSEQARSIQTAINSVIRSILVGGILAFLVLCLFLRNIRTPFCIAVSIPLSIMMTLNLLCFQNITLNIMSLGGLALGIGMLVDNSIVVSESVERHRSLGKDLSTAVLHGTEDVGMAVTAATFTTVSIFFPVVYVHGVAGELFKSQALTYGFALVSSLSVSLTLLPMLLKRTAKKRNSSSKKGIRTFDGSKTASHRIFRLGYHRCIKKIQGVVVAVRAVKKTAGGVFERGYIRCDRFICRGLHWSLDHKGQVIAGTGAMLVMTVFMFIRMPRELMPEIQASRFEIHLRTPAGYSVEKTQEVVSQVEDWLDDEISVDFFFSSIGMVSGWEALDPEGSMNAAKIMVSMKKRSRLKEIVGPLRDILDRIPQVQHSIFQQEATLSDVLGFRTKEIKLKIEGEDSRQLALYTRGLAERLQSIRGITSVKTSLREGKPEYHISIDSYHLEIYPVTPDQIIDFLVDVLKGRYVSCYRGRDGEHDLVVRFNENNAQTVEALLGLEYVSGEMRIPLKDVLVYRLASGLQEIRREDQKRQTWVAADIRRNFSRVISQIRNQIEALSLPPGYRVVFSGEREEMIRSFQSLLFAFIVAVVLVYMIMAAQFESFIHPFLLMASIPLSLTGAVWALFITGQTLNVVSMLGMIVLTGIVVNDGILKIDGINRFRRRGMKTRQAIIEASRIRLRPILITSITTLFGMLPMSLGLGEGSELQQPLAISVMGGIAASTFLALIFIPVIYELSEKDC